MYNCTCTVKTITSVNLFIGLMCFSVFPSVFRIYNIVLQIPPSDPVLSIFKKSANFFKNNQIARKCL
jgi:hypothetical protein